MQINPLFSEIQTIIFVSLLLLTLLLTSKKTAPDFELNLNTTFQLKGLAILLIIFGHIGYFLSKNHAFMFPLSVASGIGVDLFLFLSGFGLTHSESKKESSVLAFYKRRLPGLLIPLWLVLIAFIALDALILNRTYPFNLLLSNFLGFFPQSDIFNNLDSPLWYFSIIGFYYLIFPVFFAKRIRLATPFLIYLVSYFLLKQSLPVTPDNIKLYNLHNLAFPLGILLASLVIYFKKIPTINLKLHYFFQKINPIILNLVTIILIIIFGYLSVHSGVGQKPMIEQLYSLIMMFLLILIFLFKNIELGFINLVGKTSYGIYLIHWPLLFKYGILFTFLPAYLAVYVYILAFIAISFYLEKISNIIMVKLKL